jgi:hypothetical protein
MGPQAEQGSRQGPIVGPIEVLGYFFLAKDVEVSIDSHFHWCFDVG